MRACVYAIIPLNTCYCEALRPLPLFADTHHAHTRIAGARIDLYLIQCKTYLSEVTMTTAAGGSVVKPGADCFGDCAKRVDEWLGSLISRELPLESKIRRHHLKASCSSSHPYSSPSAPSSAPSSSATSFSPHRPAFPAAACECHRIRDETFADGFTKKFSTTSCTQSTRSYFAVPFGFSTPNAPRHPQHT